MKRAAVPSILVVVVLLAVAVIAEAQQTKKVPRVGFLVAPSRSFFSVRLEGFQQGLRELGYVEGKNIAIESRFGEGKEDRIRELAAELVSLKVDVIVASGLAGRAAKNATQTIPIVFAAVQDPVASGLVDSLAKPGGNVTGLSNLAPELSGKRLELLKEVVPKITRVGVLWGSTRTPVTVKEAQAAAKALGLQFQLLEVETPRISTPCLKRQQRTTSRPCLRSPVPSSTLIKGESSISPRRTGCQQCTASPSLWTLVV